MKMRSVMGHAFSQVPGVQIPRSSFDRSHGYKTTFDAGYLVPIFLDEALPGDTFNLNMTGFARMATPIFPVMDNMFMETFFFAVPYRLIWDNFQKFCGEQTNPGDSTDFVLPQSIVLDVLPHSLLDYFGVPQIPGPAETSVSALPMRAYNLIYNEWFRDQNLQDSVVVDRDDGPDQANDYMLLRRCKRHDYFTSCLPWPQKGDAVSVPLGATAPIVPVGDRIPRWDTGSVINTWLEAAADGDVRMDTGGAADGSAAAWNATAGSTKLVADLSEATAATINQLRQAVQIQRLQERDARGGSRYIEILKSHFGVSSPDARLQRPEYLGGGSTPVNASQVIQTSESGTTPIGTASGYVSVGLRGHGFVKSFVEHCLIIGLVNVRADLTYQQGLNRLWFRSTRFDMMWPGLTHIGEQVVFQKELKWTQNPAVDDLAFGYQARYDEYRYKPSLVTGKLSSLAPDSLDAWHLAQEFAGTPALNSSFIQDDPPIARVIAVTEEPHFIFDSYFSLRCARPMPLFGVPGMIDHF